MALRRQQRERQKAIGYDWQSNNPARASHFFVHFFAFTVLPRRELPTFTFYRQREQMMTNLSCSF